ncbi:MAG: hypothetical protein IPN94_23800 [Sphingobacteriales bacterium]|nr:hypothetical protein [Sphingobacteriales bacterium]
MDANGYSTRCASGCPTYGLGTSFNVTTNGDDSQTLSFIGNGLGVVGANGSGGRNLPKNLPDPSNDAAAFDQLGKVGLGDAELSEDGQYLFVVNLFDQQIYRLTLNNPLRQ